VLESLARDGVDEATRGRIKFPAGLDIQARRGDEIAVSILAEIVQTRRTLGELSWADAASGGEESEADPGSAAAAKPDVETGTAIDPVCHMSVEIAGALHTFEHDGQMYYFCCAGCRTRFSEEPEKYLAEG
jgi:xanthine dehydrogenase accessory factor